ncbi:hypothetical protein FKR81_36935 [Lentzea tibetensis]|uniref:Uncharacterized protein n=1 Tax=Lentzea tibetensis TaxID=2591470 RepID=A0A563EHN5_9PSEU|nr:hypothetical protein [Lentzea tibetensis]TWP46121.1 hypothetical protein FKR81_36935 [Lentzea tibetensis]
MDGHVALSVEVTDPGIAKAEPGTDLRTVRARGSARDVGLVARSRARAVDSQSGCSMSSTRSADKKGVTMHRAPRDLLARLFEVTQPEIEVHHRTDEATT